MELLKEYIYQKLDVLQYPKQPSGAGFILTKCLNPAHDDKHPSFSVNLETGAGKCFSCGYSIGEEFWLNGTLDEEQLEDLQRRLQYDKLLKGYEVEQKISPVVYLPPKSAEVEDGWRGLTQKTISELNIYICQEGSYENRVIFPINNYYGNIAAFNTRALDDRPNKYKYSKGIQVDTLMYPTPKQTGYLVLVEGIMDAISMYQDGIPAIFNYGINNTMGMEKISQLLELGVETIYIAFDDDEAGNIGYEKYLESSLVDYFEVKHGRDCLKLKEFYTSDAKDYSEYLEDRNESS